MKAEIDQIRVPKRRWLGHFRRLLKCSWNRILPTRSSYSSHQDDLALLEFVEPELRRGGIYLDVGANDPIHASNTYLYYRMGYRGVCIDPNADFSLFYRLFRPNDVFIAGACSSKPALMALNGESSSTSQLGMTADVSGCSLVPVFVLDQLLDALQINSIAFISIDTEGHESIILGAAPRILQITHAVLAESHNPDTDRALAETLGQHGFSARKKVGLNIIFTKS